MVEAQNSQEISKETLLRYYRDLSDGYDILQEKLHEALQNSQRTHDEYCNLIKLIINENPGFLKKVYSKLPILNAALLFKLSEHERKVLFEIIKGGK